MNRIRVSTVLVVTTLMTAGCRPTEQRTDTMNADALTDARASLKAEALAALDSGGAAFRASSYPAALDQYSRAAELEPGAAAAWFGIFMAQRALGNSAAADSALMRARSLAPGATLLLDTLQ